MPTGEWTVLTHGVARWKRTATQCVRMSHLVSGGTDDTRSEYNSGGKPRRPQLLLPDSVPALASHEVAKIVEAMPPESSGLDFVKERLVTPHQAFDVDTLLHVHQKSVHAAQESHLLRLTFIIACSITVMVLLLFSCRSYIRNLFVRCGQVKADPSPITAPRVTSAPDAVLEHVEVGHRNLDPPRPSHVRHLCATKRPTLNNNEKSTFYGQHEC